MPRDFKVYLDDILEASERIRSYTAGFTFPAFQEDRKTVDAVLRNLEVIGEAIKQLPAAVRDQYPDVPWRKIAGLRDILIHEYFGVDLEVIWDLVTDKLSELEARVKEILADSP